MCKLVCETLCATLNWITKNEVWLNTLIAFLSFLITTLLTVVVIRQTSKLAKQQSKQDIEIYKQQEELQKRQIRLDTFDRKNTIYRALYMVFQMTGEIELLFDKIKLSEKPMDKLHFIFDSYRTQIGIDVSETLWLFKQAEFVFPSNIYQTIYCISEHFDALTGDIGKLKFYPSILTEDEIESEKQDLLEDILFRSQQINGTVQFINSIMPSQLAIFDMDK